MSAPAPAVAQRFVEAPPLAGAGPLVEVDSLAEAESLVEAGPLAGVRPLVAAPRSVPTLCLVPALVPALHRCVKWHNAGKG